MKKILYFILGSLIFIFIILIYSRFIGTTSLKVNEILINTNIKESYDGLKIVHFTDLHYKKIITEDRVKELIKEINKTNPEIIVFTGDLLDDLYKMTNADIKFLIKELSKLKTKYGKYAILGDQDYKQKETVSNIYIQSDFKILNNNYTIVFNDKNDKINLIGLGSSLKNDLNIDNIELNTPDDYTIILTHEPDTIDKIIMKYSTPPLILSGHSINGSINIPIIKKALLPEGALKYYEEYYKINNTDIYISNGIGVNNLNFRLFNKPSFNLYRLKTNRN